MAYIGKQPTAVPLTTSDLADGIVTVDKLATTLDLSGNTITLPSGVGGKVLQVVSSGAIDQVVTATDTSYTLITGHSLAITPSSTSSKIFILMSFSARSNNTVESHYTIYRDATNLGSADGFVTLHDDNASSDNENQCTLQFLDSPSTTSSVTYSLYGKTDNGSNSYRVNAKGNDSVITLMEISG